MFRILVVDDEPEVARALRRLLLRQGYALACAHSGAEALGLLAAFRPHLVLTDFRMPVMNGAELLRVVAQRAPEALGVMLSGNADLAVGSKDRGTLLLEKPWNDEELCTRLHELLASNPHAAATARA